MEITVEYINGTKEVFPETSAGADHLRSIYKRTVDVVEINKKVNEG